MEDDGTLPVDARVVARAADVLMRGGIIGFPTETVYGLGANADDAGAVAAVFAAKGRPADHPLIVHVAQAAAVEKWARVVPAEARALIAHCWPGPLTVVLPRTARALDIVTGKQDTVALRCAASPWARAILQAFCAARGDASAALAAPSANRYGRISPTRAAHVRADLGEKPEGLVDFIVEGGNCAFGIESTIVDFCADGVRVLRPGALRADRIAAIPGVRLAGAAAAVTASAAESAAQSHAVSAPTTPRVPGALDSHYAPRKPLELLAPAHLAARIVQLQPMALAVFAPGGLDLGASVRDLALRVSAPSEPDAYAHVLYDALRRLDASPAQRLLVAVPPHGPAWEAIHDRLQRASALRSEAEN